MAGGVKRNCLLARLCGCCCGRDPCSEWQEATALSVRGRQVVTTHGTYTVRAGNQPVPGQTVLHNDCGHTAGARPQYRPSSLPKPQQGPLMVVVPEYDTPQRPGYFGARFFTPVTPAPGGE